MQRVRIKSIQSTPPCADRNLCPSTRISRRRDLHTREGLSQSGIKYWVLETCGTWPEPSSVYPSTLCTTDEVRRLSTRLHTTISSLSRKLELTPILLNMAITQRRPKGVIHHSDRGCQYTSYAFGKR